VGREKNYPVVWKRRKGNADIQTPTERGEKKLTLLVSVPSAKRLTMRPGVLKRSLKKAPPERELSRQSEKKRRRAG